MHTLDWYHTVIDTASTVEPVTKAQMLEHLPADGSDYDTLLDAYIAAARVAAEAHTKRQFTTATWMLYMSALPAEIRLPFPPLQSVTHVKYYDSAGVQQTLTVDTDYQVDTGSTPGRIKPAYNTSWPQVREGIYKAVEVKYIAGYGDASTDMPETIIQAVKLHVADMFRFRESGAPMPVEAAGLLDMETAERYA